MMERQRNHGQMLIILAAALVGLLAFTGLAVDLGRYFVAEGRLRQAADAAALAASAQFRENRDISAMRAAARSFIEANGFTPTLLEVNTCDTKPGDPYLCVPPRRKKVEVIVEADLPTAFLQIVGINTIHLKAEAVSEAASMDVVLVIDTSESMTYDAPPGDPMRDPSHCNPLHQCHPFEEVRSAALNFVSRILNLPPAKEQDRVAIVTFADGWRRGDTAPRFPPGTPSTAPISMAWTYDYGTAANIVNNMTVYDPGWECPEDLADSDAPGPCRRYDPGSHTYLGLDCPLLRNPDYEDPSTCTTTAIGGGLYWAGQLLSTSGRDDALWVVILLTDGAANSTLPSSNDVLDTPAHIRASLPVGYCPPSTFHSPFCRDHNPDSRHPSTSSLYDADDYARDMADYVACSATNPAPGCAVGGQSAAIFAIGLGQQVLNTYGASKPHGGALLRYVAAVGDDGDPSTDPCDGITDYTQWCGNYYFSPTGSGLNTVFEDIASRLFTRLTH